MKVLKLSATLISLLPLVVTSQANIGDFNLNADARANNVNDGSTFFGNPQSLTFSGAPASGSVISTSPTLTGITVTQSIHASLLDSLNGSITFEDGFSATSLALGQMQFGAISDYTFEVASASILTTNYTASLLHSGIGLPYFGLYNIVMYVDGTPYYSPSAASVGWVAPDTSGSWTVPLDAGVHTIGFQDIGNLYGQLDTRASSISETLNFSVAGAPVPEPMSLLGLAVAVPMLLKRRARK